MCKQYDLVYICLAEGDTFPVVFSNGDKSSHYMLEQDDVTVVTDNNGMYFNWGDDNTVYMTMEQLKRATSVHFVYSTSVHDKYYGQF